MRGWVTAVGHDAQHLQAERHGSAVLVAVFTLLEGWVCEKAARWKARPVPRHFRHTRGTQEVWGHTFLRPGSKHEQCCQQQIALHDGSLVGVFETCKSTSRQ